MCGKRGEKKNAKFWVPHPSAPTLRAPTLRASTFSGFGPLPLRASHPSDPHPSGLDVFWVWVPIPSAPSSPPLPPGSPSLRLVWGASSPSCAQETLLYLRVLRVRRSLNSVQIHQDLLLLIIKNTFLVLVLGFHDIGIPVEKQVLPRSLMLV